MARYHNAADSQLFVDCQVVFFYCGVTAGACCKLRIVRYCTCVSLRFTLHKDESFNAIFKWFQPTFAEYTPQQLGPLASYLCLQLRTYIYVAIGCTYSCRDSNTSVEMLPSLTSLEPCYDVTHSDGNAMKKLPGSVSPRLQPHWKCYRFVTVYHTHTRGLHVVVHIQVSTFKYPVIHYSAISLFLYSVIQRFTVSCSSIL